MVGAAPRAFPWFTIAWTFVTSAIYLLLVVLYDGIDGAVPLEVQANLGFTPSAFLARPWTGLAAPFVTLFNHDAVQFAYVTAIMMLAVPAFEAAHGWRRTAFVFFVGGLGGVLVVTLFVLAPASLVTDHPVLVHSLTRPYTGASTAVFAVAGAWAATARTARARWIIVAAALAWETGVFWRYYHFAELNPLFHYASFALGFALARTRAFERIPRHASNGP